MIYSIWSGSKYEITKPFDLVPLTIVLSLDVDESVPNPCQLMVLLALIETVATLVNELLVPLERIVK